MIFIFNSPLILFSIPFESEINIFFTYQILKLLIPSKFSVLIDEDAHANAKTAYEKLKQPIQKQVKGENQRSETKEVLFPANKIKRNQTHHYWIHMCRKSSDNPIAFAIQSFSVEGDSNHLNTVYKHESNERKEINVGVVGGLAQKKWKKISFKHHK
ncbi:hypothetical protein M5K25_025631 [Dendrobium thyrsiflorum]|uniref:Uncharacterized protein n=1 Tax=Dendrobium thyrsiflorum TaxID=117978 RepID=A0ABD0U4D9_DENTH